MGSTDNLAAAKQILEQPAEDLGDAEIAEVIARALVVAAENLGTIVDLLRHADAGVTVYDGR